MVIQFKSFNLPLLDVICGVCIAFYKESLDAPNPGELDQKIFNQLAEETKPLLWYGFAGGEVL